MTHRRRGTLAVKGAASLRAGMQMVRLAVLGLTDQTKFRFGRSRSPSRVTVTVTRTITVSIHIITRATLANGMTGGEVATSTDKF